MEIGIFSRTYEKASLEEVLQQMTEDGIFHSQLNLASAGLPSLPEEVEEERIEEIRALHERYHVTVDALSGTFNMIDPDPEARRRKISQFALQCRIARRLGAPMVTLCTGSRHPKDRWAWHEDNLSDAAWADLLRTTEAILPCAEENDVRLGVEPEVNNIICSARMARRYLDEMKSDRIGIIMDAANLFHPGEEAQMQEMIDSAFDLLGEDITLAHAKDFMPAVTVNRMCGPGQGIMDFPTVIARLRVCGYEGPLIMHGMGAEDAAGCAGYLRDVLQGRDRR